MTDAVKFIEDGEDWFIEGLIMPNGGVTSNGQDLTGTHFSPATNYCKEWFPDGGRPGLYGHGFDPTLGLSVVGREVKSWKDDKGVWLRAQIDRAHEYAAEIKELVEKGVVSLSSGAVDHLVRVAAKSGEITVWPWVEWSIVPNPANPEAVLYQVKSTDAILHIEAEGTEVPAPVLAIRDSSAACDVMDASMVRAGLTELLSDEVGEGDQEALIRRAIGLVDRFITLETAEIGTEGDSVPDATDTAYLSIRSILTPQSLHDAALASGATCETVKSEPVLVITEPVPDPVDLVALKAEFGAIVQDKARLAATAIKERVSA